MLDYNQITAKKYIVVDGTPYEVLSSHVSRKQARKPVNQTKLRNMISGKVTEKPFHQSEKAEEADIRTKKIKYLYENIGQIWFSEENDPSKRFELPEETVGVKIKFIKQNSIIEALVFSDEVIGIKFPIKVDLKVKEAPDAVKGNTAQGASKQITLETGAVINAPMFINEGDIIRVNTDTGDYAERVEKK